MSRHQNHLLGAYFFATTGPLDLTVRGLAQAGTWNYLREEITVALESHQPVRFGEGFHFVLDAAMPDDMWANAITFVMANTIKFTFSDTNDEDLNNRAEKFQEISTLVSSWREATAVTFPPFSTAPEPGNVFPSIWQLKLCHGTGSKILPRCYTDSV